MTTPVADLAATYVGLLIAESEAALPAPFADEWMDQLDADDKAALLAWITQMHEVCRRRLAEPMPPAPFVSLD